MTTPIFRIQLPRFSIHLNGLRTQVLLWTVLPVTIMLIIFSLTGISSHQTSMRTLAVQENTRLIQALVEVISLRLENLTLQTQTPPEQIPLKALSLDGWLDTLHPGTDTWWLLMAKDGQVLYSNRSIQSPALAEDVEHFEHINNLPGLTQALAGETGVQFTSDGIHGDIVAYAPVPDTTWVLVLREPWHSLTDPLLRFEQIMPYILSIAILVSLSALGFGVRFVVQPLQELGGQARRIGQGDFAAASQPIHAVTEIEDLRTTLHDMAQRVQKYQRALHEYLRTITRAQEDERARLARELHDETVQTLIALSHKAQMVQRCLSRDTAQAAERIHELREMLTEAIGEVRRFSQALHPHYLEELGLTTAIEFLTREARNAVDYAESVTFRVSGMPRRLPADHELALYRITQEALNNARRHAHAQNIQIELGFTPKMVYIQINDDGAGFALPERFDELIFDELVRDQHFGLIGMRERAQLVDGELEIHSIRHPQRGHGTQVKFSL